MKNHKKGVIIRFVIFVFFFFLMHGCDTKIEINEKQVANNVKLEKHTNEFKKEVIEVVEGIHVAIGYGLANSILIEGKDGVIIVDTMESAEAAKPVNEAFKKITNKPTSTTAKAITIILFITFPSFYPFF